MASADLRDELNCSICLTLYTDPVFLRCGHNFCRSCIVSVLDAQEAAGVYSCPDCRVEYPQRPALEKNRKLGNIVEHFLYTQPDMEKNRKLGNIVECFLSTQPDMEETRILCTYCDSPVPAMKSCLQCETSMCPKHLRAHNKLVDHSLIEPSGSFAGRKCSTHKEVLKYYCPIDGACICVSCWVAGDHKGHDVELLDVASEKKREKLRPVIEKLNSEREETGRRVQNLKNHGTEQEEKSAGLNERVTGLFTDLRKKLDDLERRVQGEISRQKDQVSLSVCGLVKQMEIHKDELTTEINHLEGLCNITDPLTFLQKDVNIGDLSDRSCNVIGDVRDAQCLDEGIVSQMLHRGLSHFADDLIDLKKKIQFSVMEKSDVLLDIDTAENKIIISQDLRSASYSNRSQNRPDGPKRFKSRQVLSSHSFSSGRHYWEVDVSRAKKWIIGVAGESMERKVKGNKSHIGFNDKSWGLWMCDNLKACHNNIYKELVSDSSVRVVGIYLDYKAGRLSFYQLCDPIRHLHTFTASFTGPLYAAFYLYVDSIITIMK